MLNIGGKKKSGINRYHAWCVDDVVFDLESGRRDALERDPLGIILDAIRIDQILDRKSVV